MTLSSPSRSLLRRTATTATLAFALLAGTVVSGTAATTYALPGAPKNVTATPAAGGVLVSWEAPADGNAPITSYAVSGGPGICAVRVDGSATSAFIPAVDRQAAANFSVVATNSLGSGSAGATTAAVAPGTGNAVRVVDATGTSKVFGEGVTLGDAGDDIVAAAATSDGAGMWTLAADGSVTAVGSARAITASLAGAVAIIPALDERGLTLVSRDGVVRSFGSANFKATLKKGSPFIGGAITASGEGLWLMRRNGVVETLGDARKVKQFKGGYIAVTGNPARTGGWALQADGTIDPFGAAPKLLGKARKGIALAASPSGRGVWVLNSDGTISGFGDAIARFAMTTEEPKAIVTAAPSTLAKAVNINYITDFHGQIETNSSGIGGAAVLKAYFDKDRALGTTFAVSAGDNFGAAPPISTEFEELPAVLGLNGMGLDVSTMGNHEHDRNLEHLRKMQDASTFAWVAANYSTLAGLPKTKPYTIIERDGVKVAFVGANNLETLQVATPANLSGITFQDPVSSVNYAIANARTEGAQLVVVMLHYGYAETVNDKATGPLLDLAAKVKGADVILGGHSHLKWTGVVGGTLVQQTVNAGALYGRAQLCMDANTGRLLGAAADYVTPTAKNVTPDAGVAAMVKKYADEITAKFDMKIGTVNGVFPFGGTPAVQRQGEVAIGDFIADAVRAKYKTDIVIVNGGGIRANIPALSYKPKDATLRRPASATSTGTFDLVLGDIYTVLPFGNQLATTSVTGEQIWSAMENGVSQYSAVAGRFPQISGFSFAFDPAKPVGSRVSAVKLADGTPIANDASKSYTLTTLDYMISGGDGYTQFNPSKAIIRDLYAQVVVDAIVAAKDVKIPALDGRITKL